jgi:hypothetical protein
MTFSDQAFQCECQTILVSDKYNQVDHLKYFLN